MMQNQSTHIKHAHAVSNAAWEALYEKDSSRYANEGDSEIGQRIPVLRWQSQSMAVYISLNPMQEKEKEHEL